MHGVNEHMAGRQVKGNWSLIFRPGGGIICVILLLCLCKFSASHFLHVSKITIEHC